MPIERWLPWVVVAGIAVACSPVDFGGGAGGGPQAPPPCDAKMEALSPDALSALAPCCTSAHCVPSASVPAELRPLFAACASGACVPDAILSSGSAKAASCKTSLGDGACRSTCIPAVAAKKDVLERATCAGDELCVPCTDPTDGKPTGACDDTCSEADAGVDAPPASCPYTGPLADVTKWPACDPPGARCVPAAEVPATVRDALGTCAGGLCVPEPFLARHGEYVPPACRSIGGAEGRCLHASLRAIASAGVGLPQDTCGANERCVPCASPFDGSDTGACRIACDPGPTKPPVVFAACCSGLGRCAPASALPTSADLSSEGCTADARCVPVEMTMRDFHPHACTSSALAGGVAGVCLSKCLSFPFVDSLAIWQEDCDADHRCVPCTSNGAPTHAPGCG